MIKEKKVLKTQKLNPLKIKDFRESLLNGNEKQNKDKCLSSRTNTKDKLTNKNERKIKFPRIGGACSINLNNIKREDTRSQDQTSQLYNQTFSSNMKSQLINFENNYSHSSFSRHSSKNLYKIYKRVRHEGISPLNSEYFTRNNSKEDSLTLLNGSSSTKSNKSVQRIMKFRDVVCSCNEEQLKINKLKKEIKGKIRDLNHIIIESQNKKKDFQFINYLKESQENLKPNFKIKTTFIYGNSGKPKIFSERIDHVLDMSKKISLMDDSAAYKFRDVITKKYGFKINKHFDFGSVGLKDVKCREDKLSDNHLKIMKLMYKTQMLKNKASLFKKSIVK